MLKLDEHLTVKMVATLMVAYLFYSFTSVFSKLASMQDSLSWQFVALLICEVVVLGIYAVMWQQILKRMALSTAYLFRGITLIYVMFFSTVLFHESITVFNFIGAAIVISGITLYACS